MSNEGNGYYQPPVPPPLPPMPPPRKEEGAGKYILIIGGGCLLLLLFAGAIGFFVYYIFNATADPLKVVNLQLEAVRQNDLEKAYSYCSAGFKRITNYESFQGFVNGNPQLKNSEEFTSNNREIAKDTVKLTGSLVGAGGSTPAEYHLVREGRAWKVQYIDLGASGTAQTTGSEPSRDIVSTREPQAESPSEPNRDLVDTTTTSGLRIQEIQVEQQAEGNLAAITIRFKVYGFKADNSGRTPSIHLVQDLKTYDPDGNMIPDLSRDAIKDLEDYGEFDYANMLNTLKVPASYQRGTYRCELIVHDQVGNTSTTSTTQFLLQ